MFTPANLVPGVPAGVAAAAADAGAVDAGAVEAGGVDAGGMVAALGAGVVAGPQPARMTIKPIAGAMDLNRDTGFLPPLDPCSSVQHTERPAVG
jgi:hypothetical protein